MRQRTLHDHKIYSSAHAGFFKMFPFTDKSNGIYLIVYYDFILSLNDTFNPERLTRVGLARLNQGVSGT